jgi:hypothetical protein
MIDATIDAMHQSWATASQHEPDVVHSLSIAGLQVELRAAGSTMLDRVLPPLAHHPPGQGAPDLTVHLWDLESTGAPCPPLPASMTREPGVLHDTVTDDRYWVRFEPDAQVLTAWEPAARTAWCCAKGPEWLWPWKPAPMRSLLGWWLERNTRQMIHGAAIGDECGAVVLAGPGGSGKSTTALAAALEGFGYLGDDYCALSNLGEPRVHSLYGTAKLVPGDDEPHRDLGEFVHAPSHPGEKALVFVGELPHSRLLESAPLRAVLATSLSPDGVTRLRSARPAEVLAAIAPSSIFQLPGLSGATLTGLATIVRDVPVGRLLLGQDRAEISRTVARAARGELGA